MSDCSLITDPQALMVSCFAGASQHGRFFVCDHPGQLVPGGFHTESQSIGNRDEPQALARKWAPQVMPNNNKSFDCNLVSDICTGFRQEFPEDRGHGQAAVAVEVDLAHRTR
jgi:hypothetical protein